MGSTQAVRPSDTPPRLHDRTCIITGASSGLGRQIAFAFALNGARLVVCADLTPEPSPGIEGETEPTHECINKMYGVGKAIYVEANVTSGKDMAHLVDEAVKQGGRLDVIVNNAGIGTANRYIRLHELEDAEWDKVMYVGIESTLNVNARGVYLGCKYALQQFLKQEPRDSGRRGWIVNVASILGYVGITGGAGAYCASKGAVLNLTKQIALDYAQDKIHCNAICPGFTRTAQTIPNWQSEEINAEMLRTTPWREWGKAEDVAKPVVFLASDEAAYVTGVGLPIDGGYLAQ